MIKKKTLILILISIIPLLIILSMNISIIFVNQIQLNPRDDQTEKISLSITDPDYLLEFNKTWGDPYNDELKDVAIDNDGNIYVVGRYSMNQAIYAAYIEKDYPNGSKIWSSTFFLPTESARGLAVAVDTFNNVYMAGYSQGSYASAFVVKYNPTGHQLWNYTAHFNFNQTYGNGIGIDNRGYVYLSGYYRPVPFDRPFIIKLNSNGIYFWNWTYSINNHLRINRISIDNNNNIYGVGVKENPTFLTQDGYITKVSSGGTLIWNFTWNGLAQDKVKDIEVYKDWFYVVGTHYNISTEADETLLFKYDLNGNNIWNKSYHHNLGDDLANGISIDNNGYIYITGVSTDINDDTFLAIFNSDGNNIWNFLWDDPDDSKGHNIAVGNNYIIYVAGEILRFGPHNDFVLLKFRHILAITSSINELTYIEGNYPSPDTIIWTVIGGPGNYNISINGVIIQTGSWGVYQNISTLISRFSAGIYVFTCWINNTYGDHDLNTVIITVLPGDTYSSSSRTQIMTSMISIGLFSGITIGSDVVGGIAEGASTATSSINIGMKKPGKWYKKRRASMYLLSLLIGTGASILFMFFVYPGVLSSTWIVLFGAIIGPIGFFFGMYAFVYVGLYSHKGNLWEAYYKGKTKFFWDVFKWIKVPMTFYSIYTAFNLFMILTYNNLMWVSMIFLIITSGIIGLLLLSVYILIGKKVDVQDLKNKSLDYLKEKKTQESK